MNQVVDINGIASVGTVETLSTTTTQVTAQSVSVIPVAKEAPPSDIDLKGDMTATQVALGATAGGDKPAIRPYRKLNLGQSHAPAGGISISTFRKPTSVSSSSSSSIGCGPTPGKDSLLEF